MQKEQSGEEKSTGNTNYNPFGGEFYLEDQDALEGSGRGGGEVRDDLEASGSGLGPDDEDGDDGHPGIKKKKKNKNILYLFIISLLTNLM